VVNSLDDFKKLLHKEVQKGDLTRRLQGKPHLYVVTYPDKLEWDHGVYRQTQMTYMQISGGPTGAGSNHNVVLCLESELDKTLKKNRRYTHAMICSVGMIFRVTEVIDGKATTPLTSFEEFTKTQLYCRGHIISHPNKEAYLHRQHLEVNLDIWRSVGSPNLFERWPKYIRSSDNYHDDYTPPWIKPKGLIKIVNFNKEERSSKAYSYGSNRRLLQNDIWNSIERGKFLYDGPPNRDSYFRTLQQNTTNRSNFYVENNEHLKINSKLITNWLDFKFDLILSPCAGYSTEVYAQKLDFDGEVAFYDLHKDILRVKRRIVEFNMDKDEIEMLGRVYSNVYFVWNHEIRQQERFVEYGTWEEVRQAQKEMTEKFVITYNEWDLLNMDYNILAEKVKGKNVFVNTSNIFSYHKVLLKYPLDIIWKSYYKFFEALDEANFYYWIGTNPLKSRCMKTKK